MNRIEATISPSLPQSYDNNQDEYGAPAGPVQTSNQYSATPVQQNQDSYGSPSAPVQGRTIMCT